jgi:YD repeat-containing protein
MIFPYRRFIYLLFIFLILSCSKSTSVNTVTPPTTTPTTPTTDSVVKNCQITGAYTTLASGDTTYYYTYTYNNDGRISGSVYKDANSGTNYSVSFSYSGNMIYRAVQAGANSSVDTITLNANGMIEKYKTVIGALNYLTTLTYDANQQLTTFTQQQDAYPPLTANYSFTNGDVTLVTENNFPSDTLVYDLTKPAVHGNQDEVNQLLDLGAMYIKNKHLLVSSSHGATVLYSYEYNGDGNISAVKIIVGNSYTIIHFTYNCK